MRTPTSSTFLAKCRACDGGFLNHVLDLGDHPLPNRFLTLQQTKEPERVYPLDLVMCNDCSLLQLTGTVPAEEMFSDYDYASSTAASFRRHFGGLAEFIAETTERNSTVVDIGCNDGVLLAPLKRLGMDAVGVDPAANLCEIARSKDLNVINAFFSSDVVDEIGPGTADVVTACNVFAHIEDIKDVVRNVKRLLKEDGRLILEVQYMPAMLRDLTFDNIYLEHIYYWSLFSLQRFLNSQDMHIRAAMHVPTHGWSLRVIAGLGFPGPGVAELQVARILRWEQSEGIDAWGVYQSFGQRVRGTVVDLELTAAELKGQTVAGYGAPAKSTTLLNCCRPMAERLAYIVDDSTLKQGKYTPGTLIPIRSPEVLYVKRPDKILLLAWNFAEDIRAKTAGVGAEYIMPVKPTETPFAPAGVNGGGDNG